MTRILIVGKDPSVREFMAEELAGEGHLVVAIGKSALIGELLTTVEPDLILLDFQVSRMVRGNSMERLKKRSFRLPVLTFNSYNGDKKEIRLEMIGGYGIQRFSFETLKQKIPELIHIKGIHGFEWVKEDLLLPLAYIPTRGAKDQKAI
jgi:CheY-like chemotaxis protein